MKKIFIALFFIMFNINIVLDEGFVTINLLPDFVGYILILMGLNELREKSNYFRKIRPLSMFMIAYSLAIYIIEASGWLSWEAPIILTILNIIEATLYLILLFVIILGLKDMQKKYNFYLYADILRGIWYIVLIANALVYIVPLASIIAIAATAIIFLVYFYKAKKNYYIYY